MHDFPSWASAAIAAIVTGAVTWGAFRAAVQIQLANLKQKVDKLEARVEDLNGSHHVLDKDVGILLDRDARSPRSRDDTQPMRLLPLRPPHEGDDQ